MVTAATAPLLLGCDFTSAPSTRKPIVLALGQLHGHVLVLNQLQRLSRLDEFQTYLQQTRPWVGGFDLPFGLPRELVQLLGWPLQWSACVAHFCSLSRAEIRTQFAAFCAARPVGSKFAHRATDRPAGSSPSMKWVNPPVALMMHAGLPALLAAGATLPGLHAGEHDEQGRPDKVALEAYPGLLAREVLGRRSYKSDERSKQTPDRLIARMDLIHALEQGTTRWGVRLKLSHAQRDALAADASGDALDAVLCLVQAAWAQRQFLAGHPRYGLPSEMDPLEGWIVGA
mgnify:CR=1 FL=1